MIQGFQLENGTDNYLLNELSYRPAGERTNAVLYDACGIDQYSALILASIDPCYVPLPSHLWKPKIVSSVWYTYKKGVLRTRNEVPKQPDVSGSITKVEWFVPEGKVMPNAKCYCCNLIMKFVLESNSAEERDKDLKWIDANWKPDVVEFLEEM
ncbi:hypothetical protein L596_020506 [Steinernema carpocapsae]|uniref:Uncharacterized protein n=1 Tax=Steinernema carpocapsae TaxID=34508 RepID=A0A4V6XW02_STECR|nr:hypothetical protein L596_020506 [Steinernema carpocapsae]